jgi:pilus assembly protein Flp/PilA
MKKIIDFFKDEEGAALPEYALLVALIAIVCIIAITQLGGSASNVLTNAATSLQSTVPTGS